jgi:uncharacterized protein YgbK (DUF1537 family)
MPTVLVIADDLTGALEAGAKFADEGIPSQVAVRSRSEAGFPVEVIDTESRHLPEDAAAALISAVDASDARVVYKKTDSTLRGNIAAELRALARACPDARIAYIPAYPALGRTVRNGHLYVHGEPVHRTPFASDSLNPVTGSSISRVIGAGLRCTVHDGETAADVAEATAAALADPHCRIIAGPASVAAELARQLDVPRRSIAPWPRISRCLVVCGSRHPASVRQIAFAESSGCASTNSDALWRILHLAVQSSADAIGIAAATGRLVRGLLEDDEIDAVMIFGGDTAFGILEALGCPALEPIGEILPGVAVSRVKGRSLHLITKAGGFGEEDLIYRTKQLLYAIR